MILTNTLEPSLTETSLSQYCFKYHDSLHSLFKKAANMFGMPEFAAHPNAARFPPSHWSDSAAAVIVLHVVHVVHCACGKYQGAMQSILFQQTCV